MEFKGITKKEEGKFITRYDVTYETVDKKEKMLKLLVFMVTLMMLKVL